MDLNWIGGKKIYWEGGVLVVDDTNSGPYTGDVIENVDIVICIT